MEHANILAQMWVPPAYRHCRFASYVPTDGGKIDVIKKLAEERKWIAFVGEKSRTGKTHLAISSLGLSWWNDTYEHSVGDVATQIQRSPDRYRFYSVRKLSIELDMAGLDLQDILEEILSHRCILLDELGRESDKCRDRIEYIIDDCFMNKRQLIATSNLSMEQFKARYDPSIIRRITDKGKIIDANWKQYNG